MLSALLFFSVGSAIFCCGDVVETRKKAFCLLMSMEIDLNHSLSEVEKDASGGEGESDKGAFCCLSTSTSSCSSHVASNSSSPSSASTQLSIYTELWHACAGPLVSLPKKGNVVVYFAQGHMEQAASALPFPPLEFPTFDLPPHIFCRVVDLQLLANKENDEVYAQLILLPLPESEVNKLKEKDNGNAEIDEEGNGVAPAKLTSHMFCKTLTASDTSTHGGFSVPRRAAEDCFPPLDYKEQRPSQELITKDLHGVEWKFRHIYRGQPRRHLLTTGWSIFVSQKSLVSGDAVLFLRGETGELRLGIRRAARPRNGLPDSIIKNQSAYPNVLSPVASALSSNTTFHVFYSPRSSHADFIIPYKKYLKCMTGQIPVGMRFKMKFHLDDSPERRFSGVVTGVGDIDPYRWPNSKWRSLMVRWDEDIMSNHQERVSPWDIDFSGGGAHLDFEESVRSSKVLQGQENNALLSSFYKNDRVNRQLGFKPEPVTPNSILNTMENVSYAELMGNQTPPSFTSFVQSNWFPQVLQGQEICSLRSLTGKTDVNLGAWLGTEYVCNSRQRRHPNFYPLASEGSRSIPFPQKGICGAGQGPIMVSNFHAETHVLNPTSVLHGNTGDAGRVPHPSHEQRMVKNTSAPPISMVHLNEDSNLKEKVPMCKLFGISLTEDHTAVSSQGPCKRSCTKVHKQDSLVGRAIDLSRLHGYTDLLTELERLFSMEGLLCDPNNGWRVLYTDSENDMMVVGDDPWHEFIEVVTKIHIYTQEEVEKLSIGINCDDTQSCLEEAPTVLDRLKSPSVGQSDLLHS